MAKTQDKWTEARKLLLRQALRKPVFGQLQRRQLSLEELKADIQKLIHVLNETSAGDARVFSLCLQSFLFFMDIGWPDGVFKHNFAAPGRGRPLSGLSVSSWHIHVKGRFGWRMVAKELIPAEYSRDPDEAAKKVRKAASTFKKFRRTVECSVYSANEKVQALLDEIGWHEGLYRLYWSATSAKFAAAIAGQPMRLQVLDVRAMEEDRLRPVDMTRVRNKWKEARDLLLQRALQKPSFGKSLPPLCCEELEADVRRLIYVLNETSEGNPMVYSISLQSYLAYMGIRWPEGVFEKDFAVPSRGRPLSRLSVDSWVMNVKYGYGWRRAAKTLIPAEYSKDPREAAKKVRKAAASFAGFQRALECSILSRSRRVRKLLDEIVWFEGLQVIFYRVLDRKFEIALHGRPVMLLPGV